MHFQPCMLSQRTAVSASTLFHTVAYQIKSRFLGNFISNKASGLLILGRQKYAKRTADKRSYGTGFFELTKTDCSARWISLLSAEEAERLVS